MVVTSRFYEGSPEELAASGSGPINGIAPASTSPSTLETRARSQSVASTVSIASTSTETVGLVSSKRQAEFEKHFGQQLTALREASVPDDFLDVLETQSADLQAKVLIHGRLYLTRYHLCFRSNILGFRTERIHPLKHVVSVEKGTTAKWIQNAVYVTVNDATEEEGKQLGYGSLADRDSLHESIVSCWKLEAPEAYQAEQSGMQISQDDRGESREADDSSDSSTQDGLERGTQRGDGLETPRPVDLKETSCSGDHYSEVVLDEVFPVQLEQLYNLIYHNRVLIEEFYNEDQKLTDVQISDWSDMNGKRRRTLESVMHMSNPIGPSKSDSRGSEVIDREDLENAVEIVSETQTPDVPSGKSFMVHTRTCLTHAIEGGLPATRVYCTSQCDWSSSSWLKSTITPAVIKGQKEYHRKLAAKLRKWLKEHPEEDSAGGERRDDGPSRQPTITHVDHAEPRPAIAADETPRSTPGSTAVKDETAVQHRPFSRQPSTTKSDITADPVVIHATLIDHALAIPDNPVMLAILGLCVIMVASHIYGWVFSGHTVAAQCSPPDADAMRSMPALARLEALEAKWEALARHVLHL